MAASNFDLSVGGKMSCLYYLGPSGTGCSTSSLDVSAASMPSYALSFFQSAA